jgi:hypothetical protein
MLWKFIFQEHISIYILATQNIETAGVTGPDFTAGIALFCVVAKHLVGC